MSVTIIEWCARHLPNGETIMGYTKNLAWGCVPKSEGCKNCYADDLANHYGFDVFGPNKPRRTFGEKYWQEVIKWNREAESQGHRRNVFCSSMADTFEDHPTMEQERQARLWPTIAQTPMLNWLLLTKRPENFLKMAPYEGAWPDNVWTMTSIENQKRTNERVPLLLEVNSSVHGLSVEPQLEFIDLSPWLDRLQWVIVGGESGPKARPFDLAWARYLRDQCVEADVAFFFKQIGGRFHNSNGRELDGRSWDEMPNEVPQ